MRRFYRSHFEGGSQMAECRRIVNSIPDNGGILVFNGDHTAFRKVCSETGVLSCHTTDNIHGSTRKYPVRTRDLYITWRDQ